MKKNENIYYVYIYLDTRKPGLYLYDKYKFAYEPFYVGKGHGNRYISHLKFAKSNKIKDSNYLKMNKIKKIIKETNNDPIIHIIENNLTEKNAFNLEKQLISIIGRIDKKTGPLTNLTDGGEGKVGNILNEESKNKISYNQTLNGYVDKYGEQIGAKLYEKKRNNQRLAQINRFKNENERKKVSRYGKENGMYGKKHSLESIEKNRNSHLNKKHSKETIEKYKQDRKGKNNGMYGKGNLIKGKKNGMYGKTGKLSPNSKKYEVYNRSTNETFIIFGLKDFCEKNDLNINIMANIAKGKRKNLFLNDFTIKFL